MAHFLQQYIISDLKGENIMIEIIVSGVIGIILGLGIMFLILLRKIKTEYYRGQQAGDKERTILDVKNQELNNLLSDKDSSILKYEEKIEKLNSDIMELRERNSSLETKYLHEQKHNEENLKLLENAKQSLTEQFKVLANEIFEDKSKKFSDQSIINIGQLLKPFREQIDNFKQQVKETHEQDIRERQSLKDQLEQLQKLNLQMSEEAINLTNALKGQVKTQGTWGEMILEKVLEKAGLVKGREYDIQVFEKNEKGKFQKPDAVIHLPEKRDIIIDAKVSLIAYEQLSTTNNGENQNKLITDHVQSIRNHIKNLSSKEYQNLNNINSMDFVLLFVPIEGAIVVAIQNDPVLFSEAFDKNIILVSPSTLLATLRTVENIWRYENQNINAIKIANKAGKLYDKFVGFVKDLEDIGQKIEQSQKSYNNAMKKLSTGKGNLISTSESLKEMGVKATKLLPKALIEYSDAVI